MLTDDEIQAMARRRLGAISTFDTEDDATLFATSARLVLARSLSVEVKYDPDTRQYLVIQSLTYLKRPGDRTYVM